MRNLNSSIFPFKPFCYITWCLASLSPLVQEIELIAHLGDSSTQLLKRPQPNSFGNRSPLSEPEHDSRTKNSLMNDLHITIQGTKGLETPCDYVCDFFIDHDLGNCKKSSPEGNIQANLVNFHQREKHASLPSNSSKSSDKESRGPNIRRSKRLCNRVSVSTILS